MTKTTTSTDQPEGKTSKESWRIFGPGIALVALAFLLAFIFMKPAPPQHIVIAAGSKDGAYFAAASRYRDYLANEGITLEVRETSGSIENLKLLQAESEGADVALIQGGITAGASSDLVSLGSIYYEPIWIFVRKDSDLVEGSKLSSIEGMKLAIGAEGSGTRELVLRLLEANEIGNTQVDLLEIGARQGAEALLSGAADVLFFVAGHDAPLVQKLLTNGAVRPLSQARAEAYARRHHFLGRVVLPEGVNDLHRNLPARDISLVAPVANLVARADLHPAIVVLLLGAATEVHSPGGILEQPGEFPSSRYVSFDLHDNASRYFKSGPPFLQKFLPFWAAIFVDRMIVFLIPLLTILFPLFKILPPAYRWRVRSRIYRWYRALMTADRAVSADSKPDQLRKHLEDLEHMRQEIGQIKVPLSYADELFDFHVHVELVRERLRVKIEELEKA